MQVHLQDKLCTWDPQKHEYIAIFRRKMSGYECFLRLREHEVRSNLVAVGGKIPFDPNIIKSR